MQKSVPSFPINTDSRRASGLAPGWRQLSRAGTLDMSNLSFPHRHFYLTYYDYYPIHHALRGESEKQLSANLGWIHYRALMRVQRHEARNFYAVEAEKKHWSGRELERQIESLLFDRLAKSKDKKGLLQLAKRGQEIETPVDAIKEPVVLEFLNIPESHQIN